MILSSLRIAVNQLIDICPANFITQFSQCNSRLVTTHRTKLKSVDAKGDAFPPTKGKFPVFSGYTTAGIGVIVDTNNTIPLTIDQATF